MGVAANAMSELNGKEIQYMSFLGATLRTQWTELLLISGLPPII